MGVTINRQPGAHWGQNPADHMASDSVASGCPPLHALSKWVKSALVLL